MSPLQNQKKSTVGFTIVELLIVIIIIAILATIVTVAYNGIRKQTVKSVLKDTLAQTTQAMEAAAVDTGNFASLPTSIKIANNVGVALTQVSDANTTFCVNATYKTYNDIVFHVSKGGSAEEGLCEGEVVAVLGDYNYEAGGAALDPTMASSVGSASANGAMQFNATTNENWTQVSLSWNAVPGATQYRLNHKSSAAATWYSRRVDDGSGSVAADSASSWSPAHTNLLAPSVTSLTWVNTSAIPQDASQTHYYRVQYKDASGNWSEWTELTLSPFTSPARTIPKVKNFKVVPSANWSSITLTWDGINNFAKLPGVKFRINHRTSSTATWYSRQVADGSGSIAADSASSWSPAYSNAVPPTATSLTWTNTGVIPQDASQTHEYRIQVISGNEAGPWTTITLNPLEYTNLSVPSVSGFTVTQASGWSSITLSWDGAGSFANIPGAKFRISHRSTSNGTWYARRIDDGSGSVNWDSASSWSPPHTNMIPVGTTSLTWTSITSIPQMAGQTHEYRIQVISGSQAGSWATVSLPR